MTDPKPPAASGDYGELAARLWRDLPGNRVGDLIQIRAYFAKVAEVAQLRLLREFLDRYTKTDAGVADVAAGLRQRIEKEGPL